MLRRKWNSNKEHPFLYCPGSKSMEILNKIIAEETNLYFIAPLARAINKKNSGAELHSINT